jgi:NADH dehydrogenase
MAVHLRSILGVRNRLEILLNWFWNYLTYDQAIRLIFKTKRTPPDDTDSSS